MPSTLGLRHLRFLTLLLLLVAAGCSRIHSTEFSHDIDELLTDGRSFAAELATRPADRLSDEEVIALGYLERARLGLGSPFRLVAYAVRDPRLQPGQRERLAYAVLAHTLDRRGYQVSPEVLDRIRLAEVAAGVQSGRYHLQLMEQVIERAPTPRSGERAIRLGYQLAEAERTLEGVPAGAVAHAAALIADRYKARQDAADLLRAAASAGSDPLVLLEEWRRQLRFVVEQPALLPLSAREEIAEGRTGIQVALGIRRLAQRLSAPVLHARSGYGAGPDATDRESWLRPEVATRLAALAAAYDYPPQAPVAVAVAINREALLARPDLERWQRTERLRFANEAWNEERLVAGAAQLRASGAGAGPRLPLIAMQTAVFLRSWNQEEPWVAGDPAPASKELEARFGLAELLFDEEVPEHWRPYYRRVLGRALGDLQRVLPTASLRGLTVRVGKLGPEARALALHDPGTRTIVLPPHTAAGTLAHEIAHDLDWQLARRRYGRRGGYATDMAVRQRSGDRLATSLSGLAASLLREGSDSVTAPHDVRPAEVFARGTDWFVAAALAREGRMGGYLTSFQDAAITGYGTTRSPDGGGQTVPSLFAILDHMAPVVPETRQWALDGYGPARIRTAKEMARAIFTAGANASPDERFAAVEQARDRALQSLSVAACRTSATEDTRRLIAMRHEVIRAAAAAAAGGAANETARGPSTGLFSRGGAARWLACRV
ncbi:MAG: hypothetical protein ACR2H9_07475, partial [Longimicrobiaceae bacterium]